MTLEELQAENARLKAEVERLTDEIEVYKEGVMKSDNLFQSVGIFVKDEEWVADGIAQLIERANKAEVQVDRLTKITDVMRDAIDIYRGWVRLPGDGPFREHLNMIIDLMQAKDEWNARQHAANDGNDKP
jgi:hypothetical protein